ncbi:adhesive plaque matrix protein-like [Planococcus citri]|uniref:adhesive plaque matrix protein-like n=1 Tax=Planococcus citri TaxID=170843 RepID=UPI0031F9DD8A
MYLQLASICAFMHAVAGISVASTSSPYTNPVTEPNYASPSTVEPSADYKLPNQYPYSRQFFEPIFTPSNQYAESLTSPSPVSGKQFLLHRFPFFPSLSSPYNQQPSPYEQPGYLGQSPYGGLPAYPNQPLYEPHYPLTYPQKFARNPYVPDCDYHAPAFRNTKPLLFYPSKPDPFLDSQILAKPSNSLFRYQPPPYGANYANNIYH